MLPEPSVAISVDEGEKWLTAAASRESVTIAVNAERLVPRHGRYRARVTVTCAGALNSPQTFGVDLDVPRPSDPPRAVVVVDDLDALASPGFWLRPRFSDHYPGKWKRGHGGTLLTNGARSDEDAAVRFTPDLAAGKVVVSLHEATPWRLYDSAPDDVRFAVRVRHRAGTEVVWVEPLKDRRVGTFEFAEGTEGWVEILSRDSRGQVVADAVRFDRP